MHSSKQAPSIIERAKRLAQPMCHTATLAALSHIAGTSTLQPCGTAGPYPSTTAAARMKQRTAMAAAFIVSKYLNAVGSCVRET